jgi:hypothetical protein
VAQWAAGFGASSELCGEAIASVSLATAAVSLAASLVLSSLSKLSSHAFKRL